MKINGLRWWVVGLVALATVINYIDRQTFGVLWSDISQDIFTDLNELERKAIYGSISTLFILFYAFGQAIFGKIFDWIGTRLGFALSIGIWSLATISHAFAKGLVSFSIFRSILGLAESGNWPGAAKANAEWFPTKERALAQGIFNSGSAIGSLVSYPFIGLLAVFFSWQYIFIIVGILGLIWLLPWFYLVKSPPKNHPWLTDEEKKYILTGQENQTDNHTKGYNPSTAKLFKHKESWGVIIASAAIDPIWWLFIIWIPIYLSEVFGMNVKEIAFSAWLPYVGAMLGAWFGGLLAKRLIQKGKSTDATRKITITLGCLIMMPALIALSNPGSAYIAVIIMAVVLFGFQTAIGNIQTLPSDFFSGKIVGTLAGFAGMTAKLSAAGLTILIPWLTSGGNYTPAFIIGVSLAIIALASIWILCPKIEPLKEK